MDAFTLLLAGVAAFFAGLLDSIVGGGGLIMTPAMVNLFPDFPILQVIATQRTSSIFGTSVAAWNYLKVVKLDRRVLIVTCVAATLCSALGVQFAKRIDADLLKYIVLGVCVVLALYTAFRKDFGQRERLPADAVATQRRSGSVGAVTGFYNGLIGPGTGTLMVFGFVGVVGFDFLGASALAKLANVAADLSSWFSLMLSGFVVWTVALPLVIGNMLGSHVGSKLAIRKGDAFIRRVFLLVVLGLIARFVWMLFLS
jgi:uncharacterized membrane protein YfcA